MNADSDAEISVAGPAEGEFRWILTVPEQRHRRRLGSMLDRAVQRIDTDSIAQLWIENVHETDDSLVAELGFVPYRDLWQLRCDLPAPASAITTRGFEPADLDELVAVNNRAFHWHPEQGGRTADDLARIMAEPWFDPDGLRVHRIADRLAGFCWTKIHAETLPPLGEIYVIAVDPDFHGRGLGVPMTLAGLDWLADHGLRHGMLYVEADNDAANATYERIGFRLHQINRAYRRDSRP